MEFDISRVYTPVNADELKVGSICAFADSMAALRQSVKKQIFGELKRVVDDKYDCRFMTDYKGSPLSSVLAYLIEEPASDKPVTNRELARWLAQGKGEWKHLPSHSGVVYTTYKYDESLANCCIGENPRTSQQIVVRRWEDTEWHTPTNEYLRGE